VHHLPRLVEIVIRFDGQRSPGSNKLTVDHFGSQLGLPIARSLLSFIQSLSTVIRHHLVN
jgi:hypothetical protein